jgi:diguanylate cyclase (GGDEF)-like protein
MSSPTDEVDFHERYAVLLDIGRILTSTLEPAALYRTIYEQASRVLETTGFFISLYDGETDEATVVFYADRGVIGQPGATYRGSRSRAIREQVSVLQSRSEPGEAIMFLGHENDHEITRSVLAAPMVHEDQVLGVISAQSYQPDVYREDDLELLSAIADLAAVAVWNARTVKELERQRRESQQLEELGRTLSASLELGEVLEQLVHAAIQLAEADGAGVWLVQDDDQFEMAITAGDLVFEPGTVLAIPDAVRERLRDHGEPIVVDRRGTDPVLPPEILDRIGSRSVLAVPMVAEGQLIGALSISHKSPRTYGLETRGRLQRLAFHAAGAVANARLHDQVRTLSLTDPLTRLPNRRHMEMFLSKEFAAAQRGRDLTLVMFDLDGFKRYNDTAGHQAGDDVLRRFAAILDSQTRAMNLAARYGGDEFLCILSDTDAEGGATHATRVIEAVDQDPDMCEVGASAGIATYQTGMRTPDELIRRADEELYQAKSEGSRITGV